MFKRTLRLFSEKTKNTSNILKPNHILDLYEPNDRLLQHKNVYELRGEYLPRRKINPFKKTPMNVIYDQNDFAKFVLPSRREHEFSGKLLFNKRLEL